MDKNKLNALQEVEYVLQSCCGNCFHSRIGDSSNWGTCSDLDYYHAKHSGGFKTSTRLLSINRHGKCKYHKFSEDFLTATSHFFESIKTIGKVSETSLSCPLCKGLLKDQIYIDGNVEHGNFYCVSSDCYMPAIAFSGRDEYDVIRAQITNCR